MLMKKIMMAALLSLIPAALTVQEVKVTSLISKKSAKLIKGAKEIYYPGPPHGITATHQDRVNFDLLQFLRVRIRNY
jgi:hypothetical protein